MVILKISKICVTLMDDILFKLFCAGVVLIKED